MKIKIWFVWDGLTNKIFLDTIRNTKKAVKTTYFVGGLQKIRSTTINIKPLKRLVNA